MTVLPRTLAASVALALGLGGALVVASPAAAAAYTVTKSVDDGLIGSLTYALANLSPGNNTITVTVGAIDIPGAIPDITEDVDIVAAGGAGSSVTIQTTDTVDHFVINDATVTMTGLNIRPSLGGTDQGIEIIDSDVTLTDVSVEGFDSGVTAADSTLTATDSSFVDNASVGVYYADSTGANTVSLTDVALGGHTGAPTLVGAVLFGSGGTISLTGVTVGFADAAGLTLGSDTGDISLDGVTIADSGTGIQLGSTGGSLTTARNITIDRTFAGLLVNSLDASDLDINGLNIDETDGDGVDITATNGSLATIATASVTASSGSGFAFDATDSTVSLLDSISSNNGLDPCGCGGSGVFLRADNSAVAIDGTRLLDNTALYGGGLDASVLVNGSTVTVSNSTISGNEAVEDTTLAQPDAGGDGGGIAVSATALDGFSGDGTTLTISDSTISGNTSSDFGGGIYLNRIGDGATSTAKVVIERTTVDGNHGGGYGAGIAVNDPAAETNGLPTVLVDSSTLSNNVTPYGGGGIHIRRGSNGAAAVVTILNTTVTGNDAQLGGGVDVSAGNYGTFGGPGTPYVPGPDILTTVISRSTIADNSAHTSAGVAANPGDHRLEIDNSILSGGTSNNGSTANDLDPSPTFALSYSLVQAPRSGTVIPAGLGNLTGVSPALGPLANNGGTTLTRLISPGSPAYNAGDPAFVGTGLLDQRGLARVVQRLDLGAVEDQTAAAAAPALARTGSTPPEPEPPLLALLLILSGLAMVAFSRLRSARSVS